MAPGGPRPPGSAPCLTFAYSHFSLPYCLIYFLISVIIISSQVISCKELKQQTSGCTYDKSKAPSLRISLPSAFVSHFQFPYSRSANRNSGSSCCYCCSHTCRCISYRENEIRIRSTSNRCISASSNKTAAATAASAAAAALGSASVQPSATCGHSSASAPATAASTVAAQATPPRASAAAAAADDCVCVVQLLHVPSHAAFASLIQEALQCLLWGSDSDLQVSYEFISPQHLQQQRQQQLQQQLLQALEGGAVEVRTFLEHRSVASAFISSSSSSNNSSSSSRLEKGCLLVRSLSQVTAVADLVVPAALRRPDGAAAIRMAAEALQQQQQPQLQQQLRLLQRCRAALPLRSGALWSTLLCLEVTANLRNKTSTDVLPLAVQAVESSPLLGRAWSCLGHALRLRGRLWESFCCYKSAALLGAPFPNRLREAMERNLNRVMRDPRETLKALPTLMQMEIGAPWGFAVDANPASLGGCCVGYVVEGSKADKAGLQQGDQIVVANDSVVMGLPFSKCLDSLRVPRGPQPDQLWPLRLQVFRGPLPLLYGATAFAELQRLGAVRYLVGDAGGQQQPVQQQKATGRVPVGRLRAVLQTTGAATQQLF